MEGKDDGPKRPRLNPELEQLADLRGIEKVKAWLESKELPTTKERIVEHAIAHGIVLTVVFIGSTAGTVIVFVARTVLG
ncbi:hypothetical protein [Bradyrhizobium sp. OK095]|uniref:hypothetical protein n=1 Tax=Bradyrhizobium sp. OK095 TaxID=1882760 RepID=UPI00115FB84E|nr:hypothetical protein [Bradyrhizobium sp. OK095]